MEEKKVIKISLSTFFLILAIIVILVMGIFLFKLYNEKTEEIKKSSELQTQVNSLNGTVSNLQGKINTISETVNSNPITENNSSTTTTNTNDAMLFTDAQVKTALSNYLELQSHADCGSPLDYLAEKGNLNYDASKNTFNNGAITTSVKFSDYKNAMLNYVSESEFEKNWTSVEYLSVNSNGYITIGQMGGGSRKYTINSITKIGDLNYSAKVTSTIEDDNSTKEDKIFNFTIKSSNGNCVIDSIK